MQFLALQPKRISMSDFHKLTVASVNSLTPNSVALTFNVPTGLETAFSYLAGQYITIKHKISGKEVRRAYSISSAPSSGKLTVGIKKVENGAFSVYANEKIKAGDVLEVMPPDGRFIYETNGETQNIAAFAAGSGITPIMSIAKTVLEANNTNRFVLIYGNQKPEEAMYLKALEDLLIKYTGRFFIQNLYSRSSEQDALFGRIETSTVNLILKNKFKDLVFSGFYLCGPEAMITAVSNTLKNNGIPKEKIHFELFTSSDPDDTIAESLDGKTKIEVLVDDENFSFEMDQKTLILDAVLKEDIDAPYSCQGGVCSSCIARVTEGKAEMVKNQILTDSEVAEGLILTCQAHALTATIKIDYDDV